jgi:lipoprotein-releasing system permease protein
MLLGLVWLFLVDANSMVALGLSTLGALFTALFSMLYVLSVFTTVSVMGVVLGVASLITVLSVTSGFEEAIQDKILGFTSHLWITQEFGAQLDDPGKLVTMVEETSGVVAAAPFLLSEFQMTTGKQNMSSVAVKGVDPAKIASVSNIDDYLTTSTLKQLLTPTEQDDRPAIVIGHGLARKLNLVTGDSVTLVAPPVLKKGMDLLELGAMGSTRRFVVWGVFRSGYLQYDESFAVADIGEIQDFLNLGDKAYGVEVKIEDLFASQAMAKRLNQSLDEGLLANSWQQINRAVFEGLSLQKLVTAIVLMLIIVVAAFNLVSALTATIVDKTQDIAILRAMGASQFGVAQLFVWLGLWVGFIGTVVGASLGVLYCFLLNHFDYNLDPEVYMIDSLPITVASSDLLWIVSVTMLIVLVATLLPSRRASALMPVDGLRYD